MRRLLVLGALLALVACATPTRDLGLERLSEQWSREQRETDRNLAPAAALQVDALLARWRASTNKKERAELEYLVGQRIAIFRAGAELSRQKQRMQALDVELDALKQRQQEIALENAHLEAEKLRLRNLAEKEAAERAQAEVEALLADRDAQILARDLAVREAELARELAEAQTRKAELAEREAALRGEQVDSLRLELKGLRAQSTPRGKVVVLNERFFAPGQSSLAPSIAKDLQPLLDIINRNASARVTIEGHTDSKGTAAGNEKLSLQRAESVKAALLALGADAARLSSVGKGESVPVASNDTAMGRAQNRRVEVWLEQ
jgi:outer membrane protein OmpA-like peptidoglycan-associated protein